MTTYNLCLGEGLSNENFARTLRPDTYEKSVNYHDFVTLAIAFSTQNLAEHQSVKYFTITLINTGKSNPTFTKSKILVLRWSSDAFSK